MSKAVKEDYGGKLEYARLHYHNGLHATSFFGFARRQNKLRHLEIRGADPMPYFLASTGLGHFVQLKELTLLVENIPLNGLSTLGGLIAEGALPVLELFEMCKSQEKGATVAIMRGFQAGGCPLLTKLDVPVRSFRTSVSAYGHEAKVKDEEQTERNLEALAKAFEARAATGTCQGLRKLHDDEWLSCGRLDVRIRLLRALLPST